jgi:Dyp-type peroxidase family
VFRQLDQLVPEFDQFLDSQADRVNVPGHPELNHEQKKELLGARLIGRWKSGAPVDLAPVFDNPAIVQDKKQVNNFSYLPNVDSQIRCPFHAHVRKTVPRADLAALGNPSAPNFGILDEFRITRSGIPYGPEVTEEERESHKTEFVRGLAFVCYQSDISSGFRFLQRSTSSYHGLLHPR